MSINFRDKRMKITITLTEKEILSLVEIISRKDEISKPTLMYEDCLSSVINKIDYELKQKEALIDE